MFRLRLRLPALALLTLPALASLPACKGDDEGGDDEVGQDTDSTAGSETADTTETGGEDQYHATIRRTSHGVAHITADDYGSLGFGQGYAFTQDKGCYLADQVVKVRSQRARYFGAGEGNQHVYSDFAYLHLHVMALAEAQLPQQSQTIQDIVHGYAAGFNAALAAGEIGGDCDGQDWVGPLSATDLFAYYIDLGLLASSRQVIAAIGSAQPPNGGPPGPAPHVSAINAYRGRLGSNGWGIGSDISASGRGMVMGNPHFPWEGELQLWESHLRIPGEFEVYGVGLLGVPGVLIGFNEAVAWTHTVSDGQRLTIYQIVSPPGEPTKYYYDDEIRDMTSEDFTIDVKQGDGTLQQQTRTMWRTQFGPMAALDPFYWTDAFALSVRDANIENFVLLEQFFGMNSAKSLEEFQQVHMDVAGIPWVNTMAAAADGRAWYMDSTPTPNLSQAAIDAWYVRKESGFTKALADQDVWLLESGARDEWQDDPGARSPGLVAPANMPALERDDYIFNANDSYWMTNPEQLLTGYSPLHGFAETGRSVRTRMNAVTLAEIDAGMGFAGADGKLDLDELSAAALSNRGYTGELLRDQVVDRCEGVGVWEVDGVMVDIAEACDVLAGWDGLLNLDSAGALLWREWIGDYDYQVTFDAGALFEVAFDAGDPVNTPHTLAPANNGNDRSLDALAGAVLRLDSAGIAVDATPGDAQFVRKADQDIPVTGGNRFEGVTNLMVYDQLRSDLTTPIPRGNELYAPTSLTDEGYQVNYGSSFIMAMQFTDEGPEGRAILTYSQSAEVDSPWFADQTEMFSNKQWRPMLWSEADIAADPNLVEYEVGGSE
ncbi:penicillin acylase family protein [Nannocystaceae bacterium ST9]